MLSGSRPAAPRLNRGVQPGRGGYGACGTCGLLWHCRGVGLVSVCPSCGRYDDSVYVRFGGALVCRVWFVSEEVLGSWLGLEPDPSPFLSSSIGSSLVGSGSILLWR